MSLYRTYKQNVHRGFTLIELMVTIAIIVIMTAIVIIKYGAFNSSALLKSQAYEIALNLREAQTFAVSVRGQSVAFRDAYGINFRSGTTNQYWLFADADGSGNYNSTSELVGEPFTIDPRFRISSLRNGTCTSGSSVTRLDITFTRPDFDAAIQANGTGANVTYACITIASVTDSSATRSVEVSATGQITVK